MQFVRNLIVLLGIGLMLVSCGSTPTPVEPTAEPTAHELDRKEYFGSGEEPGDTFLAARNAAIMDAVRKAVKELIGDKEENNNFPLLDQKIYKTKNPNAYIYPDTLEALNKEIVSEDVWRYDCRVDVNLEAVRNQLKALGLYGDAFVETQPSAKEVVEGETETETETETEPVTVTPPVSLKPEYEQPTAEESQFIAMYIGNMTYVVLFNEESREDEFVKDSAISKANEYLGSLGVDYFDLDQVMKLKKDQEIVFEETQGEDVSLVQWIAQKLNADVYIEIDALTKGESKLDSNGRATHYGTADVTIKAYETSTGDMLGSQTYKSDRAIDKTSQKGAVLNAVTVSIWKIMPRVISQAQEKMTQYLVKGIRYEVILQNTSDSKVVSRFRSKLKDEVKDIETISQSAEETKFYVRLIGSIDDLEDMIYDVSDMVSGLEGIELVIKRGKSMTFDTGM